jgi:quinol monooxygenase YgiN
MAAAFLFEAPGISREQYDGLMESLGRADINSPGPEGFIVHIAGPTDSGWRALDVWESEAAAQAFYGSDRFQSMLAGAPPIQQQAWPLYRVEIERTMRDLASP